MSDPKLQRADGFSIFATLIVAAIIITAFFFIQEIFRQDEPLPVSEDTTKERLGKIELHRMESEKFNQMVESFNYENNSSIESVMRNLIKERYEPVNTTAP
jgi:hypothetical protein